MKEVCEICGRGLSEENSSLLEIRKFLSLLEEQTELKFWIEWSKFCEIYDLIGSCFYCDTRRLIGK